MYNTLIILKPGTVFSVDEMLAVVQSVAATGRGKVQRLGSTIQLSISDSHIEIGPNNSGDVLVESAEIAEEFGFRVVTAHPDLKCSGRTPTWNYSTSTFSSMNACKPWGNSSSSTLRKASFRLRTRRANRPLALLPSRCLITNAECLLTVLPFFTPSAVATAPPRRAEYVPAVHSPTPAPHPATW